MATKKSQAKAQLKPAAPQASTGMDSSSMWRWVYVVGGLVAALAGAFSFQNQYLSWALMLAGVLVGLFHGDTEDVTNTGVRYLLLGAVYGALSSVPAIGPIITGFVGGFFAFRPMMLALLILWFWKSVVSRMM